MVVFAYHQVVTLLLAATIAVNAVHQSKGQQNVLGALLIPVVFVYLMDILASAAFRSVHFVQLQKGQFSVMMMFVLVFPMDTQ